MEFGLEKCAMKTMNRKTAERIELRNQENIRTLGEKENRRYMGILEADAFKQR